MEIEITTRTQKKYTAVTSGHLSELEEVVVGLRQQGLNGRALVVSSRDGDNFFFSVETEDIASETVEVK